jgi:LysR family transcriptional regulator, flagellar master operon regulator
MDINQAKTFLTIVEQRNFNRAAEKLFITQSTVSARVKTLEDQLGCTLFVRNKAGVTLTEAAKRFQKHAQSIVQLWDHARLEIAAGEKIDQSITIGARFGLWEPLLLDWLPDLKANFPRAMIGARIGTADTLIQQMHSGTMDVCLVYSPFSNPGLRVAKLFDEQFVLLAAEAPPQGNEASGSLPGDYIYVDWGQEFARQHALHFPDFTNSLLSANLGALAQALIISTGGTGYLPRRTAAEALALGDLHRVVGAPTITLPVYMVYSELMDKRTLDYIQTSLTERCGDFSGVV